MTGVRNSKEKPDRQINELVSRTVSMPLVRIYIDSAKVAQKMLRDAYFRKEGPGGACRWCHNPIPKGKPGNSRHCGAECRRLDRNYTSVRVGAFRNALREAKRLQGK